MHSRRDWPHPAAAWAGLPIVLAVLWARALSSYPDRPCRCSHPFLPCKCWLLHIRKFGRRCFRVTTPNRVHPSSGLGLAPSSSGGIAPPSPGLSRPQRFAGFVASTRRSATRCPTDNLHHRFLSFDQTCYRYWLNRMARIFQGALCRHRPMASTGRTALERP